MRGFVRKRGSTWTWYFQDGRDPDTGKKLQRSKGGFRTKKDAERALAQALSQRENGTFVEPNRIRLRDFLTMHWLPSAKTTIRYSTWDSYRRNFELHVIPRIGTRRLQDLTPVQLNELYTELLDSGRRDGKGGLAPKTVRNIHLALHKALVDAVRWGLLVKNPAEQASPPSRRHVRTKKPKMRTWTAEELREFLDLMRGHKHFAPMYLAATTGMRRGEILGLRWGDIHFEQGKVSVEQTLISVAYELSFSEPKTDRGRRSIAVDATTLDVLAEHRRHAIDVAEYTGAGKGERLVFCKPDGSPYHPDWFRQVFERKVAGSDLPRIRFHDLRHTYATLALRAGVHPKIVSERLGHATVAMTLDIYSHAVPDIQAQAADTVAKLILGTEEVAQSEADDEEGSE